MAVEWTCEAYGLNPYGLCFYDAFDTCKMVEQCAPRMWIERRQLFARLRVLAETGDETSEYLLTQFTHPDQLLGGPRSDEVEPGI